MEFIELLSVINFLIPLGFFVFGRKLLDSKLIFSLLLLILLLTGVLTITINFIGFQKNYDYLILINPVVSLLIYRFLKNIFKRKFKRLPIDTFMDWREGFLWDRIFNIGYIIFGILFPYAIILIIIKILK